MDKIYPGVYWFAKGGNANNDPWRGYIFCFFIAFGLCMIASLNEVSVIASNFFLAAYALMNLSVFHSSITKLPSWRPAFTWYDEEDRRRPCLVKPRIFNLGFHILP